MARKHLGDRIDIHTGGEDNIFPHHECEIAQSESANEKPFVRYWVHCGWLTLGGEKMSKSKGQLYTIPELVEMGYDGRDIRMFLIRQHYRAPLPFQLEVLDDARQQRARINNFVHYEMTNRPEGDLNPAVAEAVESARAEFREALEDNLNTSRAFAVIHELMTTVNRLQPARADAETVVAFMREADRVLDILDDAPAEVLDEDIERLIEERLQARKDKNFARADEIRDELAARGIELLDTPQGTRWKRT
jgi:cysteinyl-tRNA synthetase